MLTSNNPSSFMLRYDPHSKRIGSYLIDAGLLTEAQVDVILSDQVSTGMKFGEIAVMRGWLSQKTLDFISTKVMEIERGLGEPLSQEFVEMQKFRKRKAR
ncbi:hypothetical protein [Lyngbya confervoides]|uniref:Uncharacterized protein n=1 Tax=Lyngbya confervoides BDU141951 TaxID=1574623 RepID=A0ABD4T3T9_9CYAN|nr:hypothetical protein [Lyngbya confervoides]MCM1983334.1 hypothetical protein [Lyngbya confervoides BDU141951]